MLPAVLGLGLGTTAQRAPFHTRPQARADRVPSPQGTGNRMPSPSCASATAAGALLLIAANSVRADARGADTMSAEIAHLSTSQQICRRTSRADLCSAQPIARSAAIAG